jgi:hypothetical protein
MPYTILLADDDHGNGISILATLGALEHLRGADQPHRPAIVAEVLVLLGLFDVFAAHGHGTQHVAQRECIGFARYFHEQRPHDRQRQRQLEMEVQAAAGLLGKPQATPHGTHHVLHGVEPDTAAGDLGNGLAHAETRQQQELEQLGLR